MLTTPAWMHSGEWPGRKPGKGDIRIMVATNAFGMGIDKPDVRFVCHFDVPDAPEAYFQEAGRAGRDGQKAYAVLLYNPSDERRLKQIFNISFPNPDFVKETYQDLYAFLGLGYGEGAEQQFAFSPEALPNTGENTLLPYGMPSNTWNRKAIYL